MSNNNFDLQPNHLSQETVVSMRTRVIAGVVAALIVLPFLFLGDYAFMVLAAFVLSIAVLETIRCAKKKYSIWLYIVTFILALTITFWPVIDSLFRCSQGELSIDGITISFETWRPYVAFKGLALPISSLVIGVCALFILVVSDASFEVRDACYMFTMILVISLGIQSLMFLKFVPLYEIRGATPASNYFNMYDNLLSALLFIYVALATFMTDIGAYFVGVLFGKHKMNPRISPKKTWEGFFGGMITSALFSLIFLFSFAIFKNPLLPFLDLDHWYYIVGLSLIIPPVSVLGDFVFSSIKRYYNIKDFGKLIPGHGGILDRIDSIIFSCMVAALFISLIIYWR